MQVLDWIKVANPDWLWDEVIILDYPGRPNFITGILLSEGRKLENQGERSVKMEVEVGMVCVMADFEGEWGQHTKEYRQSLETGKGKEMD